MNVRYRVTLTQFERDQLGALLSGGKQAARHAKPPDRPFLVETDEQIADRRVEFGQAVEAPIAQSPDQPAFDDQHDFQSDAEKGARAARRSSRA